MENTAICPLPIWKGMFFETCWIDVTSCLLLLFGMLAILTLWLRQVLRNKSSSSLLTRRPEEHQGLLAGDEAAGEESGSSQMSNVTAVAYAAPLQKYEAVTRSLAVFIMITYAIDGILDVYHVLHPAIPSATQSYLLTHFLAGLAFIITWILCLVFMLFSSAKDISQFLRSVGLFNCASSVHLERFWRMAFVLEGLRLGHWGASYSAVSKLDIAFLAIMCVRFVLLFSLVLFAFFYRASIYQMDMEARGVPHINSWTDTIGKIRKLIPFLWPQGWRLQLLVVACFFLLGLGRLVNVLVPLTYKYLVDDLIQASEDDSNTHPFVWLPLLGYTFFRFLQGGVGILSSLQYFLWIPVGQYTTREICVRMLEHLHSLSLQFHINSKTGELLRVMDRGTSSIGSLLSYLAFNILPVFVDIVVAVFFFSFKYDATIATIIFVTMILYIFFTIWITEWRTKFRREMNDLDAASRGRAVDSLLNFETVKYFGNESWEVEEYERAIRNYQVADWKSSSSLNLLNTAQNVVITLGLLSGLLICAKRVQDHQLSVGDFVGFITYLLQLYQPLNWFGTYYRVIQQNFVDMEKMLELFEKNQSIKDDPKATDLELKEGTVTFNSPTEALIQSTLNTVFSHRTRIVVAHRLSTVVDADQILVVRDGRIVEQGSHTELLARQQLYFQMWNRQVQEKQQQQFVQQFTAQGHPFALVNGMPRPPSGTVQSVTPHRKH
ncbi:Homocysteine S-methyltransferase 1 [Kappamyces sp. JEL0680]|nr:Homocysteine S-methyltransferase 1 [Kappamyces sp. JEL0680]